MAASSSGQTHEPIALMFPGQGSQFAGMASDLARESTAARDLLRRADDILGYPLTKVMAGDQGDDLDRTVYTQPAVFVHSMALWEVLRERYAIEASIAAGHSLGEYSALCAAEVLTFEDALEVIRVRATGMDEAQPVGTCGMAAVIGLTKEQILSIVEECRGNEVLEAANFNAPDQVVISGHLGAVKRAVDTAGKARRTRAVMLPVSSAFHTSLMGPALQGLSTQLERVATAQARFPVVANVTAAPYPQSPAEIKRLLVEQVRSPVRWEECVRTMLQSGAARFFEVGPGKVLTGLMRRIDKNPETYAVCDMESIRSLEMAG